MVNEGHSTPHSTPLRTIFVDTSIGTHLAIVVSLHDTISDVKAKIRAEHALCFQDIGDISIQAVKVRRRSFFYNLADSMYVMNAFDGLRRSWFIYIVAIPIRPLENQEVVMSKVTHEHLEPYSSTVPVCCVDRHEGIVSSGLSPKKQDVDMNKLLAQNWNMVIRSIPAEQERQKSQDTYFKELTAEDGSSLRNGRISAVQNSQVLSVDELIPGDSEMNISNKMMVNQAHLHGDTEISIGKISGTTARECHNPISMSVDHEGRPELLIDREKDGERKKYSRDIGIESSDGMPSAHHAHKKTSKKRSKSSHHVKFLERQSQHHLVEKKKVKKVKDCVNEEHYEDHRRIKFRRSENINESICNAKRETLSIASEVLPSNLPVEDTLPIQNFPAEKQNKRKRKSSKSHEVVCLAMSSETLAAGSLKVTTNPCNSGKDTDASKYPTEANIYESLPNDDRDTNIALNAAKLLGSASQMEKNGHSMEISMPVPSSINKTSIENQFLQINPAVQSGTLPLHHSPVEKQRKKRKSSKILATSSKTIVAQSSEVTIDQNHSVKEKTEHPMEICMAVTSSIIEPTEELILQLNDVDQSELAVDLGRETDVDVCLKESEVCGFSKTESSMICEFTEVSGGSELLNSDCAQIFVDDIQNKLDAAKFIKEADQKANGGHCFDTVDESSSSSKKVLGQSKFPASELSNLGSPEITNVVLLKSNGEIKKSTEVSQSDPSTPANGSNQAVDQYSINSMATVPLSGKDSSNKDEVPWVIPVDPTCSEHQDLNEQINAKVKTKEDDGTHFLLHGALAGPTKSKHGKKSKNAELKIHDSSEIGEHMELCRPDVGINFFDYFVSKTDRNCPDVSRADLPAIKSEIRPQTKSSRKTEMDLPSIKYEIRPKTKSSRKTEINQPHEGSPTDLMQFAFHKEQMVESQTQENYMSDNSLIACEQDIATKDSKSGNARNRKQPSSKQKGHNKHKLEMKLQDYGPQSQVQLSKSGEKSEQGRKIAADGNVEALSPAVNHGIDNMFYKDDCVQHKDLNSSNKSIIGGDALGANHCDVSLSGGKAYMTGSSDSTENTLHEIKGYRVVRRVPRSRLQKVSIKSSFEKSLLAPSGRMFSDVSDARFDSDSDLCKKKAITTTASNGVTTTADSGMHPEEIYKKSIALKPQLNSHFSDLVPPDKKCPTAIPRSSSSYKNAKLTVSQSDFENTESRPIDVVLETQPEPTP